MKVSQNPAPNSQAIENAKSHERAANVRNDPNQLIAPSTSESAEVDISDNAKLMKTAVATVNATPTTRTDRVAALKKQVREGSYRVDASKVADKLVDEHLLADFGKNRL